MGIVLYDADLGSHLYKKRVALANQGKRGGFRIIIGAQIGKRYFLLYAFAKNQRANINVQEKLALKELTKELLRLDQEQLDKLIKDGELIAIKTSCGD